MTDDRVYLGDILERIERIEAYTQEGREEFLRLPSAPAKPIAFNSGWSDSQFRGDRRGS